MEQSRLPISGHGYCYLELTGSKPEVNLVFEGHVLSHAWLIKAYDFLTPKSIYQQERCSKAVQPQEGHVLQCPLQMRLWRKMKKESSRRQSQVSWRKMDRGFYTTEPKLNQQHTDSAIPAQQNFTVVMN